MALVGEELEDGDEICGAVVSLRSKVDRIQLWTRSKDDVEKLNAIGKKLVKLLDVSEADNIGLDFQVMNSCAFKNNNYTDINPLPRSTTRMTVPSPTNSYPFSLCLQHLTARPSMVLQVVHRLVMVTQSPLVVERRRSVPLAMDLLSRSLLALDQAPVPLGALESGSGLPGEPVLGGAGRGVECVSLL